MWTSAFWKGVIERAVKTFAQALLGVFLADGFNVLDVEGWKGVLVAAAMAVVVSVLTSLVSNVLPSGPEGSASLVHDRAEDEG
jgi:hypothetical protein